MAHPAPVARQASLDDSPWLPTYAWWPPPQEFDATVVLSTYQAASAAGAEFSVTIRGYSGSPVPLWEQAIGHMAFGEQRAVRLSDVAGGVGCGPAGGILEVHVVRLDAEPRKKPSVIGMWVDAVGIAGGGYLIPTTPIRGAAKVVSRDDLQVIPGVMCTADVETELLLLNPIDESTTVTLVVSSLDGLTSSSDPFVLEPWGAWKGDLSSKIRRARRLLAPGGGIGSLAVYSSHKVMPFFGFRKDGRPVSSMDHAAPMFG